MSLIMVEHVPRAWLWVAPTSAAIGYISPGELACQIVLLDSRVDLIMNFIACVDETTTEPVSPPPRY